MSIVKNYVRTSGVFVQYIYIYICLSSCPVLSCRLKHDATLSEAYALFRAQDSVPKLRGLLRRRWNITFRSCSSSSSSSKTRTPTAAAAAAAACCGKTNATSAARSTTLSSRVHSSAAVVGAPSSGKKKASAAFGQGESCRRRRL